MNQGLFLSLFFGLGLLYFSVGLISGRRASTSDEYFVAGRSLGTFQISANLIATQLGGGIILGTSLSAYESGWESLTYPLGIALGFLFLSGGIAEKLQETSAITVAQLFEIKYRSQFLRQLASLLSIFTLFGILVAQVICIRNLIASFHLPDWIAIVFWLLVVGYTMLGGMRAITWNDMIQLGIIFLTFGCLFVFSMIQIQNSSFEFRPFWKQFWKPSSTDPLKLVSILLNTALFSLIEQDLAQRFFSAKTRLVASRSAFLASIGVVAFALIPIYFGIMARIQGVSLEDGSNPFLTLIQTQFSPLLVCLVICSLFAAIISTADALINGISANLTQDIFKDRFRFPRECSFFVGLIALMCSYWVSQNVIDVFMESYELSVSTLFVPLMYSYYQSHLKKSAAIGAILFGLVSFLTIRVFNPFSGKVILSLFMSLIGYQVGSFYEREVQIKMT